MFRLDEVTLIGVSAVLIVGCSALQSTPALQPTAVPGPAVTEAPTIPPLTASPTTLPTAVPPRSPTDTPPPRTAAATAPLPTVETSAAAGAAGFLRAVELDLDLQQPVTDVSSLRQLVDGVQQLDGVTSVSSDGVHILIHYDSIRILPTRIRDRLRELGHPARGGTDVQNPGDAAD